jgi:hypothetical protein
MKAASTVVVAKVVDPKIVDSRRSQEVPGDARRGQFLWFVLVTA